MSIKGSVPAHTLYGSPANVSRLSAIAGARLAAASGPYVGRGNKCSANEDTCEGIRAKGTEYCMGHIRKFMPEAAKSEDKPEVVDGV